MQPNALHLLSSYLVAHHTYSSQFQTRLLALAAHLCSHLYGFCTVSALVMLYDLVTGGALESHSHDPIPRE